MAARPIVTGFPSEVFSFPQQESKIVLDYIYVDDYIITCGQERRNEIRDKIRVVDFEPQKPEDCPLWHDIMFNEAKENYLNPVAVFKDPFKKGKNKNVLCEFLDWNKSPTVTNTRAHCEKIMSEVREEEPWFGLAQEYFITDYKGQPIDSDPKAYYDDTNRRTLQGMSITIGLERQFAETHLQACIYAGLKVVGMKREKAPGQWEYKIGPCCGTEAGDQLIVSKFILMRLAELFGVEVSFKRQLYLTQPMRTRQLNIPRINRLRIKFSTKKMREEGGLKDINEAIQKIGGTPGENLHKSYNLNNENEIGYFTPPMRCEPGIMDERQSVRIPLQVLKKEYGYFEERRPCSNANPYVAIAALTKVVCL